MIGLEFCVKGGQQLKNAGDTPQKKIIKKKTGKKLRVF